VERAERLEERGSGKSEFGKWEKRREKDACNLFATKLRSDGQEEETPSGGVKKGGGKEKALVKGEHVGNSTSETEAPAESVGKGGGLGVKDEQQPGQDS